MKMTADNIYRYIDTIAPFSIQDGFDNSGLLVGDRSREVKKAAVCLDITNDIVEECHSKGTDLIISHHPVIFTKIRSLDSRSPVYRMISYNIAAICAHTNFDMVRGGISDIMYRLLGFGDPENAPVLDLIHRDSGVGYGRIADLSVETTADKLAELSKKAFNCKGIKYCDGGKPIKRVAVSSGAGNDFVYTCINSSIDALISGDIKHHGFVDARNSGVTVIDAGHYATENILCEMLLGKLKEEFPDIEFFIPEANGETCRYI